MFTEASDVWSAGVCLWEIQTLGQLPYGDVPAEDIHEQILSSGARLEAPEACPEALADIMARCWLTETSMRPTFAEMEQELAQLHATSRGQQTAAEPRPVATAAPAQAVAAPVAGAGKHKTAESASTEAVVEPRE